MTEYHKITTLWAREDRKPHNMIVGKYALPEFELLKDINWISTEKIDGTNVRVIWDGNKVSFGGKTDNAQMPIPLLKRLEILFRGEAAEQKFEEVFGSNQAILYGEGFGARIQKGGGNYISDGVDFILFDVKIDRWWLGRFNVEDIAHRLDIPIVPIVFQGTLLETSQFVQAGFTSCYGEFDAEGVVAKPEVELFNRKGERILTKLKVKDFKKLS